jgi:hypothetical protein
VLTFLGAGTRRAPDDAKSGVFIDAGGARRP